MYDPMAENLERKMFPTKISFSWMSSVTSHSD